MNLIQKILLESELGDENEFDLNSIFQPNPNQIQRYKEELERRKKEFKENFQKTKLGLKKINKAYENKEWESEEEKLFLKSFYNCEVELDLTKYPNNFFIIKNNEKIAYQNLKYKLFVIDYYSIWEVFQKKFNWNDGEIQSFIKIMLNEYFKLNDYRPMSALRK